MWSRRNIIAISAIIALAVVIVLVTALVAGGRSEPTASIETTAEPPAPNVDALLLDRGALSRIMGNITLGVDWRQDFLSRSPDDSTSLPACVSSHNFGDAALYADAPWRVAREESLSQPDGDKQFVRQAALWIPGDDAGSKLLDRTFKDWTACQGKPYKVTDGTRWQLQDVTRTGDIVIGTMRAVDGPAVDWSCQHALGVKGAFAAEAQACGRGRDQAQRVVEEILAKADG